MKYVNLRISPNNNNIECVLACSHGDCGQKLYGNENYCPNCGSPLKKLPDHLDKELLIALVNKYIDKITQPIADTPKCPYGHNHETCKYLTPKHGCMYAICASQPPKLQICPFHGVGYIDCADAY